MMRLRFSVSLFCCLFPSAMCAAVRADDRPNIVLVITDDQGYGDLSCHGNPVLKTPHLDALYAKSVRLTNYHVSPTCAPTRSSLLTGRHEFRSGVTHTIFERDRLNPQAVTFPQLLRDAGYATGIFGKWHLGDAHEYQPLRRGFTESFIHGAGGIGQDFPGSSDAPRNSYFNPAILHNDKFEKTKGYCTDVFFSQAMSWIEATKDRGPFYCHISTNAPHGPLHCPEEYIDLYRGKVSEEAAKFFGMIANIDDNMGRLTAKLRELGIEKKTLVIFTTDNGGTAGVKTFNAGMRASKGTPFEGGIRVPSFWSMGDRFRPGDVSALTAHVDLFPTLLELAGVKPTTEVAAKVEGRSLVPLLKDHAAKWDDRYLFTHVGRWERGQAATAKYDKCAVRNTRFKMVSVPQNGGGKKKGEQGATSSDAGAPRENWQLFDMTNDPGETTDVSEKHPDVVRELTNQYDRWWDSIQADLVNENRDVTPEKAYHELYWRQFPEERPAGKKQ